MRDDPRGTQYGETVCKATPGCGLRHGHPVPCRGELDPGELVQIDENGEDSDATKGSGQGSYRVVKQKQLTHGRAQAGRLAL
jgi:hypothetical protein